MYWLLSHFLLFLLHCYYDRVCALPPPPVIIVWTIQSIPAHLVVANVLLSLSIPVVAFNIVIIIIVVINNKARYSQAYQGMARFVEAVTIVNIVENIIKQYKHPVKFSNNQKEKHNRDNDTDDDDDNNKQ